MAIRAGRQPCESIHGDAVSGEDAGEKSHEASPRRLEQARQRGDSPRSQELISAAGLAGLVAALLGPGRRAPGQAGSVLQQMLSPSVPGAGGWRAALEPALLEIIWMIAPVLLLPLCFALLAAALQNAFVLRPSAILPQISRISPMSALKHRFGLDGLANFAMQLMKVAIVLPLVWFYVSAHGDQVFGAMALVPGAGMQVLIDLMIGLILIGLAISLVLGIGDLLFQHLRFRARHRMSQQELVEEMRESEGNPETKSRRRQRAEEIAMNRMMADVPKSNVVIVNPTHYAVALRWQKGKDRAPVCVAKGVDAVAARIRAAAAEAGVPIRSDPPTARALHARVEIGQQIPAEHYRAVAAAIRFAEAMRKKERRLS